MRSYTNKKGDSVQVSQEHLDIAIRIKEELQKLSPSRKCNWKKHKEMMQIEGFEDSDTNESYRCLIKAYQKSVGKLPEAPKYAEMVSENTLQSIKKMVGNMAYEKRENQHVLKQLNKVKRDVIDKTLLAEQIRNTFENYDWSQLDFTYEPVAMTGKKMVVFLSDLHIGALVDIEENKYNFDIALERINKYANKIMAEIELHQIEEVYVMNLGDVIEHPYMHNLSYTSEFTFAEQLAYASDIIIKFIKRLSEVVYVRVAGIAGNHDRINEDKNKNLYGDHAVKNVNLSIKSFIENSNAERIAYEQAKDYEHSIEINGLHIKCVHGDLDNMNDKNVLGRHNTKDGKSYSIIVMGHYHHHWIKEIAINKFMVGFGSLKGADAHGDRARLMSSASQGYILVDENGDFDIRNVKLS